jgi:hypothetical protein
VPTAGGDRRLFDVVPGVGFGEDETRVRSPSGRGEHPRADGDSDRQPGYSGHGSGTFPAFHSVEHVAARHGEHDHAGRPDWVIAGRAGGLAGSARQHEFCHGLAAAEA